MTAPLALPCIMSLGRAAFVRIGTIVDLSENVPSQYGFRHLYITKRKLADVVTVVERARPKIDVRLGFHPPACISSQGSS